jgi:tRNA U34 5-carboxymethylaminomethyl modifying GTPase MnmE/TrmE
VIEQEGIARAKERFSQADVKLCMFDATTDVSSIDPNMLKLIDEDTIILLNKLDLTQVHNISQLEKYFKARGHAHVLSMSCTSGAGTQDLLTSLEAQLKKMYFLPHLHLQQGSRLTKLTQQHL